MICSYQHIVARRRETVDELRIPAANETVLPGVSWGDHTVLFTPAYWRVLAWLLDEQYDRNSHRLGSNLAEEVVACLLGGYGIPAEVGLAAYRGLRKQMDFQGPASEKTIHTILAEPMELNGRLVRYRFANTKSRFISNALTKLTTSEYEELTPIQLRAWLMSIDGIGFKTASWITRNWTHSDEVAIIDIHIHRAGILMNLFEHKIGPARNYLEMERRFLDLAHGIDVRPSDLDALIWREMRSAGSMVLRQIGSVL
jgi:N-glycosylase/DNA lyase